MTLFVIVNIVILLVLGALARAFGKASENATGWSFNYSTRDIVILAVIAAIAGVVNTGMGNIWYLANSSLGPLGGALLQGAFMWAYVLVMWLIRKPGAALFLGIIEASVEILLGNAAGVGTLGWGISQGLAIEVVMAMTNYKNFDILTAVFVGAAASQFGTMWTSILFGWDPSYAKDVWMAVPINLISGAIFSGLIGYWLAQAIGKTGLVRSGA